MKINDNELRAALQLCMEREEEQVRKEMENAEEHIFSDEFNRKMDQLFADIDKSIERAKKRKKRINMLYKAAPVGLVMILMIVGLVSNKDWSTLHASDSGIKISVWCDEFFSFRGEKEDITKRFEFDETQIGYIPGGFKKTEERIKSSYIYYKYENEFGNYIYIKVEYNNSVTNANNENVIRDVRVNEDGIEYHFIENHKNNELNIIFQGNDKYYYMITGNIAEEEIIKIMNEIDQ